MARNKDLEHFRSELQEVDRQMGNIVNAVVAGFSQSAFAGKLAELEKEKARLETAIQELSTTQERQVVTVDMLRGMFTMFRQYITERNVPEIRKFIGNYVKQVIVYRDHVEVVFFLFLGSHIGQASYEFQVKIDRYQLLRQFGKVA